MKGIQRYARNTWNYVKAVPYILPLALTLNSCGDVKTEDVKISDIEPLGEMNVSYLPSSTPARITTADGRNFYVADLDELNALRRSDSATIKYRDSRLPGKTFVRSIGKK